MNKSLKKKYFILTEDKKSSINYFNSFKKNEKLKRILNFEIEKPEDHSPKGLLKEAKDKIKKYKSNKNFEVWIVFDKDKHQNISEVIQNALNSKIRVVFNNICFEYWILIHFMETTKNFNDCNSLLSELKSVLNYEKGNFDYSYLHSKISNALTFSRNQFKNIRLQFEIECPSILQSYTNFYELFDEIFPKDFINNFNDN